MQLRDALKTPKQCEDEDIRGDTTMASDHLGVDNDGDVNLWPFARETRRRLIRVEERQALLLKVAISGFIGTIGAIVAGIIVVLLTS